MKAQRIHLLLVEDDDLDVMNVHRALASAAEVASITVARDGIEALKLLRAKELPMERLVVVLDLRMPRMGGLDLLREIRADANLKRIPTVVLSTSDDAEDREAAYSLGAAGYFVKPAAPGRFRHIMDALRGYWSSVEFPPSDSAKA
ncbi:MAG: response regulator [Myxococcota bacterium]|nr:response regulator [Deltaproteobacteria bacterium]MDQ3339887.1 response regulator [Myxococcota bacterium]